MNEINLKRLDKEFRRNLAEQIAAHPERYSRVDLDGVANRVMAEIRAKGIGAIDITTASWAGTLRALGLPATYKAIQAFLDAPETEAEAWAREQGQALQAMGARA